MTKEPCRPSATTEGGGVWEPGITIPPRRGNSEPSEGNPILTNLVTDGFQFTSTHMHALSSSAGFASNGTVFLANEGTGFAASITMTKVGGGAFALTGLDAAEVFIGNLAVNASRVRVVGTLAGGGTVTTDLNLGGVINGGPLPNGFQTFSLSGFGNVTSVTFSGLNSSNVAGFAYSIDTIGVEEAEGNAAPAGAVLFAIGFAGLGLGRRLRRKPAAV